MKHPSKFSAWGALGGKSKSRAKREAGKRNIVKAQKALARKRRALKGTITLRNGSKILCQVKLKKVRRMRGYVFHSAI